MSDFRLADTSILFADDGDEEGSKPMFRRAKLVRARMVSRRMNLVLFANILLRFAVRACLCRNDDI